MRKCLTCHMYYYMISSSDISLRSSIHCNPRQAAKFPTLEQTEKITAPVSVDINTSQKGRSFSIALAMATECILHAVTILPCATTFNIMDSTHILIWIRIWVYFSVEAIKQLLWNISLQVKMLNNILPPLVIVTVLTTLAI